MIIGDVQRMDAANWFTEYVGKTPDIRHMGDGDQWLTVLVLGRHVTLTEADRSLAHHQAMVTDVRKHCVKMQPRTCENWWIDADGQRQTCDRLATESVLDCGFVTDMCAQCASDQPWAKPVTGN